MAAAADLEGGRCRRARAARSPARPRARRGPPRSRARPARAASSPSACSSAAMAAASSANTSCSMASARSAAATMRLSVSTSSAVVKRTAPAMVWRWRKVCGQRLAQQRLGGAGRHLDVVAQDVVVAHLERLDAGLLDVAGLQRGHHLAAVVAQRARLVEVGAEAGAHEAAVAAQVRRLVDQRAREQRLQVGAGTPSGAAAMRRRARPAGRCRRPPSRSRRAHAPRRRAGRRARRRGRAGRRAAGRAATWRGRCRARCRSERAQRPRAAVSLLAQEADRVEPRADRLRDRAAGSRAAPASSRAPGPVTVRSMAASRLALRSPDERAQQLQARAASARR